MKQHTVMNQSEEVHHVVALAVNVELAGGKVPEWVELIPAGPRVQGRDGRAWLFDQEGMASVLSSFQSAAIPKPIDWEHATEVRAAKGEDAPAAGWISKLEDRGGALVGFVEWTPKAKEQLGNREYRFLSPVFHYEKESRRIREFVSAGLTNTPNLHLTALNRQVPNLEDYQMDPKALCKLLGLQETATEQEITGAVTRLQSDLTTAKNRQLPDELLTLLNLPQSTLAASVVSKVEEQLTLAKAANKVNGLDQSQLAPKADLELAMNRATAAEKKLAEIETKTRETEIETAVNKAMADGKIAPASKDFYLASCRKEGGLDDFSKFIETAPQLIKNPVLPASPDKTGTAGNLDDSQLAICKNLGLDPAEFAKSLKEDNA